MWQRGSFSLHMSDPRARFRRNQNAPPKISSMEEPLSPTEVEQEDLLILRRIKKNVLIPFAFPLHDRWRCFSRSQKRRDYPSPPGQMPSPSNPIRRQTASPPPNTPPGSRKQLLWGNFVRVTANQGSFRYVRRVRS